MTFKKWLFHVSDFFISTNQETYQILSCFAKLQDYDMLTNLQQSQQMISRLSLFLIRILNWLKFENDLVLFVIYNASTLNWVIQYALI